MKINVLFKRIQPTIKPCIHNILFYFLILNIYVLELNKELKFIADVIEKSKLS